ncbi:MAG: imelysin family protein [Anaerolineae bacterium]
MKAQRLLILTIVLVLGIVLPLSSLRAQDAAQPDLDAIKDYLLEKATALADGAAELAATSDAYYQLTQAANFDYTALWDANQSELAELLAQAKTQWITISPLYEQMEGIVAGVPSLAEYDVIIDAGASAEEDAENAADFNITLPDGTVMEKPGNLFGLLESALWGTRAEFVALADVDLDGNSTVDFGEVLPDANILKGTADSMVSYTSDLLMSAIDWQPNETDAFTALVVMVPTMSEYFGSWKESRFVAGDKAISTTFAVISRLSDIQDILASLQVIYDGVGPLVESTNPEQHEQINQGLTDLKDYVGKIFKEEQDGHQFTPEEADFFGTEAQNRAMTITGQITQAASLLDITLPE